MKISKHKEFTKWFDKLKDDKAKAKIVVRIDRVSKGNFGNFSTVGEGVSELKIDYGPGYRVYFTQKGEEIVILLCGGDKRTQDKDIVNAKEIKKSLT